MGLDIVEMVMEVEEEFGVRFDNSQAAGVQTVGQLHAILLEKLRAKETRGCVSSAVFYRMRRALMETTGVAREQVRLSTPMAALLPIHGRTRFWREFQAGLGPFQLPPLLRPRWLVRLIFWPVFVLIAAGLLLLVIGPGVMPGLSLIVVAALLGFAGVKLSAPLAVHLPSGCANVRDTTRAIVRSNYTDIADQFGRVNETECWRRMCLIVAENLGVTPASLTPDTRFVEDMGAS